VTSQVERLVAETGFEVVRTPASLQALTEAAAADDVVFAGAVGGGYVFPEFLPGYDAVASLAKLLELLAAERVNVVEVEHQREAAGVPVGYTGIELTLLTRDGPLFKQLLEQMRGWGYPVERLD